MKFLLALALIATTSTARAAPDNCQLQAINKASKEKLSWTGPCQDGWAEGTGVIDAKAGDLEGWRYEGQVQHGLPHGHGYMKFEDGREYEGEYVAGQLEGLGIYLSRFRDRYDGSFKQGKRDGRGSMAYSLGGRYDGNWKDDKFNGRGVAEYPGGRKLDTTFIDGLPAGKAAPVLSAANYRLAAAEVELGSNLKRTAAYGSDIPLNKSYAQMSESERNSVRARYPLMDDADEPPFPLMGLAKLQHALGEVSRHTDSSGVLSLIVKIDSEGNATSVSLYSAPDEKMGKYAAQLFMLEKYKPALCAGKPCAMAFPMRMRFVRR